MGRIGICTLSEGLKVRGVLNFLYSKAPEKIKNNICLNFVEIEYEQINIDDWDIELIVARLPITEEQIRKFKNGELEKLCNKAIQELQKKQIEDILVCKDLELNRKALGDAYENLNKYKKKPKNIFMALCVDVSKRVCKILGMNLFEVGVKVIEESYSWKSKVLIDMMSVNTKYITLVTNDIEDSRNDMEKLYEETGLTVHITNEYNRADEVSMIYMLDGFAKHKRKYLSLNTIAFVFDHSDIGDGISDNIIIDGVDIKLRDDVQSIIRSLKIKNTEEFLEAVMSIKMQKKDEYDINNYYEEVRRIFKKMGCSVNALKAGGELIPVNRFDRIAKSFKSS